MYQYTPRATVRINRKNETLTPFAIVKTDLQTGLVFTHTFPVSPMGWQLQRFWDFYTHPRRQTRHDEAAGFFMPVDYTSGGLSRVCVDYNTANGGNKRVVTLGSDRSTRQLLPNSKTYQGENLMNATTMGNRAQNPLQALVRLLPVGKSSHVNTRKPPIIRRKNRKVHVSPLVYKTTQTGFIGYLNGVPVAWVVQGYHNGQCNHAPRACTFVDVAYHRQTLHGVNLETLDFDTLSQAFDFLSQAFSKGGAV
ncbi:hypothetical protein [Thiothrix sp.]|uniref:hypothetical protein n=1 Tax=Thiothrix sp. TaxID=1032 RepID=UPI00257F4DA4|nr:hypothetical protein [Thiothrix sp.]